MSNHTRHQLPILKMSDFNFIDWGLIPYSTAYEQQKTLFEKAINNKISGTKATNTLIFCEHPHVITIGKHGKFSNLLYPKATLEEKDISLFHIDRGGDVTYHGPGQLVVYPVFDLESFGLSLKSYIHLLEESVIRLLALYNIRAGRLEGATGVWIDTDKPSITRKICAIGVRASRYVSMHGLALNVNTDLSYFKFINPCGFVDKGVTSMQQELGIIVDMNNVKQELLKIIKSELKN